jgi:hypothetical protein
MNNSYVTYVPMRFKIFNKLISISYVPYVPMWFNIQL